MSNKIAIFQRPGEKDQLPEGVIGAITNGVGEQIKSFLGDDNLQRILPFHREDGQLDYVEVGGANEQEFSGDNIFKYFTKQQVYKLRETIKGMDGLILPGGLYSDKYEVLLARLAVEENVPILAICGGQNNLVRAFGGTTGKSLVGAGGVHYRPNEFSCHGLEIVEPNSKFAELADNKPFMCNSYHSSSLKTLGNTITRSDGSEIELAATGLDDDGNIEVVEGAIKNKDGSKSFDGLILATRFHPEIQDGTKSQTNDAYNSIKKNFFKQMELRREIENLKERAQLGDTNAALKLAKLIGPTVKRTHTMQNVKTSNKE